MKISLNKLNRRMETTEEIVNLKINRQKLHNVKNEERKGYTKKFNRDLPYV